MDDSLFEDVPYQAPAAPPVAQAKMDDSLFEDTPHPESELPKQQEVGAGRAALLGAGKGATFGFDEELTAPVAASINDPKSLWESIKASGKVLVGAEPTLEELQATSKMGNDMQMYRDIAREESMAAQEQHPGEYMGGAIAGGLLTLKAPGMGAIGTGLTKAGAAVPGAATATKMAPGLTKFFGNVAKGGIEGTGYGAVSGLGEGEGDLSQRLDTAKEMAETGGIVGAALPIAGQALRSTGRGISKIGESTGVSRVGKNFRKGLDEVNLAGESARKSTFESLDKKAGDLFDDASRAKSDVGSEIGNKIQAATEAGEKVNITDEVAQVKAKLKNIRENGGKQAASNAAAIESEIDRILGIKAPKAPEFNAADAPEGLNLDLMAGPKDTVPKEILVDPTKAQDLKQILQDYSPKRGVTPAQEMEGARAAQGIKSSVGEKLNEVSGVNEPVIEGGTSLNEQYGGLKDSLKLLRADGNKLPEQIKQNLTRTLARVDDGSLSGSQARQQIDKLINQMAEVDPALAEKYRKPLNDAIENYQMAAANDITYRGKIGTFVNAVPAGANLAGQGLAKIGAAPLLKGISNTTDKAANFANTMLNNQSGRVAAGITSGSTTVERSTEPYKLQRQVASASEKSDPETLKSQASQIRSQYGETGERLAVQLERMADKNRDARRALMFTILQDPNNRKMLGLSNEENKQ